MRQRRVYNCECPELLAIYPYTQMRTPHSNCRGNRNWPTGIVLRAHKKCESYQTLQGYYQSSAGFSKGRVLVLTPHRCVPGFSKGNNCKAYP